MKKLINIILIREKIAKLPEVEKELFNYKTGFYQCNKKSLLFRRPFQAN